MPVHVRFRFNKITGEVEEFLIDDQDRSLPEAEHDRIAIDVGQTVVNRARPLEVLPSAVAPRKDLVEREESKDREEDSETLSGKA